VAACATQQQQQQQQRGQQHRDRVRVLRYPNGTERVIRYPDEPTTTAALEAASLDEEDGGQQAAWDVSGLQKSANNAAAAWSAKSLGAAAAPATERASPEVRFGL
jgi:hypothetical protein